MQSLVRLPSTSAASACFTCALRASTSYAQASRPFSSSASRQVQKKKANAPNPNAKTLSEAYGILKEAEKRHPWAAFEIEVVTKVDKSSPPLRGTVSLPFDARKNEEKILVFAEGEAADAAKEAGATFVGGEEIIPKVLSGEIDPSRVIAHPAIMPAVTSKLARYLGPKGLMPAAKRGTVLEDVASAVRDAKGSTTWKGDKQGHVRAAVARIGFPVENVEANVRAFVKAVKDGSTTSSALDNTAARKASPILKVNLGSTMGPTFQLNDVQA